MSRKAKAKARTDVFSKINETVPPTAEYSLSQIVYTVPDQDDADLDWESATPQRPVFDEDPKSSSLQPESKHPKKITDDEIRALAYAKWSAAGCPSGDGMHFWLEAEQELR